MKKACLFVFVLSLLMTSSAEAQFAAQRDASHMIIVRVISEAKMEDQEFIRDIEDLRENQQFNRRLERMLGQISNERTKNARNREVVRILQQAGRDIERALNVR